jgi:hypothetical protein
MMTESAKAMAAAKTVSTTEVMPTAVKATATAVSAETTGGRGRSEHRGRSERDEYESKFTKHFILHLCGAVAPFQCCEVMPRARAQLCVRSHRLLMLQKENGLSAAARRIQVVAAAGYRGEGGNSPAFAIASAASGEARKRINASAASGCCTVLVSAPANEKPG